MLQLRLLCAPLFSSTIPPSSSTPPLPSLSYIVASVLALAALKLFFKRNTPESDFINPKTGAPWQAAKPAASPAAGSKKET